LFVDQAVCQGAEVAVGQRQAHYLTRVMRLAGGDGVRLFNGRDGEWLARLKVAGGRECMLSADKLLRAQTAEPGPALAFAPIRKERMHFIVEKATELGVERLLPVVTCNTVADPVNVERMRAQAIEAAEQCGRLTIPAIDPPQPLKLFFSDWTDDRPVLFMNERPGSRPIAAVIEDHAQWLRWNSSPCILIGPEGGFAAVEAEMLEALAFVVPVSLGPRILRAETAAIAALACWQALAGDWRPLHDSG
jgi:16S rRNA (uracil1498-N3)-methyltransferase